MAQLLGYCPATSSAGRNMYLFYIL